MQQAPSNNTQMRTAAIVTIVVIIGLLLVGRFVTGMMDNNPSTTTTTTNEGLPQNGSDTNTYNSTTNGSAQRLPQNSDPSFDTSGLGPVVTANNVDRDNCAVDTTTTFNSGDPVYVVLEDSAFPSGTTLFARLYRNNVAVEDTRELTASENYDNTCVSFVFEPSASAEIWQPGTYEAEFFVNGNSYRSTTFEVR